MGDKKSKAQSYIVPLKVPLIIIVMIFEPANCKQTQEIIHANIIQLINSVEWNKQVTCSEWTRMFGADIY